MARSLTPLLDEELRAQLDLCDIISPEKVAEDQRKRIRATIRELRTVQALVRALDRHMSDPVGVGFAGVERARARLQRRKGDRHGA